MSASFPLRQIVALRMEAREARRLAEFVGDGQSVADLESYADELERHAAELGRGLFALQQSPAGTVDASNRPTAARNVFGHAVQKGRQSVH